jgi:acetyl esterase
MSATRSFTLLETPTMKPAHELRRLPLYCLPLLLAPSAVLAEDVKVTLEAPQHGSLQVSPSLPADGTVATGTTLTLSAAADAGYALDSLYTAVPGMWGFAYNESMQPTLTVTVNQDTTLSALFLPAAELSGFTFHDNIVYAQPGVKPLKYDVWSPEGASKLPIVVIVHGGGWVSNTEDIMRGMAREIVKTGRYVVASIDYRWAGTADGDAEGNSMHELIGDVFGALAHIQEHADSYGGDATRIAVTGDSAGGHLSAAAGTMIEMIGEGGFGEQEGVFEFMPSYLPAGKSAAAVRSDLLAAVKATAPSYGVFSDHSVDMPNLSHQSSDARADASWAAAIAPINHIPAASVRAIPQYFVRGTADMLIRHEMVQDYVDALQAKGQHAVYDQVEGANHAFFDWKPDQTTRDTFAVYGVPYTAKMVAFFDQVFQP